MAIAFRSASIGTTYGAALPTGNAQDDILIAVATNENPTAITAATGWTLIDGSTLHGFAGRSQAVYVFWIRRGASAPATNWSGGSSGTQVSYIAYSGCITTGSPVDTYWMEAANNTSDSTTVSWSAVTTTNANCMIIGVVGVNNWAAGTSATWTNERGDGGATSAAHLYDNGILASPGSSGSFSETIGDGHGAFTIALLPDAGGGGGGAPPPDAFITPPVPVMKSYVW
jgi:hypothetical protein